VFACKVCYNITFHSNEYICNVNCAKIESTSIMAKIDGPTISSYGPGDRLQIIRDRAESVYCTQKEFHYKKTGKEELDSRKQNEC